MKVIFLWLLISISDSQYNRGSVALVERFATKEDCNITREILANPRTTGSSTDYVCVPASIAVPLHQPASFTTKEKQS
jgi:hypothetical protein